MRFARPTQIKSNEGVSHSSLLFTLSCCSGGRTCGPPLCGGDTPRNAPLCKPRRRRQLDRLRPATGAWTPAPHLPTIYYPPVSVTEREKARKTPFAPPASLVRLVAAVTNHYPLVTIHCRSAAPPVVVPHIIFALDHQNVDLLASAHVDKGHRQPRRNAEAPRLRLVRRRVVERTLVKENELARLQFQIDRIAGVKRRRVHPSAEHLRVRVADVGIEPLVAAGQHLHAAVRARRVIHRDPGRENHVGRGLESRRSPGARGPPCPSPPAGSAAPLIWKFVRHSTRCGPMMLAALSTRFGWLSSS